ncbi:MAG: EI24 domain-containing protein [Myxococcaceae bacterium]|nr:EI24 domain-containing protein [Myxococcaceae bacterium]
MRPSSAGDDPVPTLGERAHPGDFFTGLSLPFRAVKVMLTTPAIFAWSLLASVVTAVALIGLLIGLWPVSRHWGEHLFGAGGWREAAGTGVAVLTYLFLLAVSALTVPTLLLAPLQDPISEATEVRCGDFTAPPFSLSRLVRGALLSATHNLARLFFMLAGLAVLFPLNFIPVAGNVIWGVAGALWSMWWLAVEYVSGPMARHMLPFKAVLRALAARPALALGLGAALYVMLWVPVVNFFLVPTAVVSATLCFRALKRRGVIVTAAS